MRPIKLKLCGLRTYRAPQEIDFTDIDLMAVIGDTGAGKSSLLEAMCFALYGVSTWEGRGGGALIAANGDGVLRVELTFRARGELWRVIRTASKTQVAIHSLRCLDTKEEVDGATAVTKRICDLVGFDAKTFLKAVVLPQGRFQELLQSKESDRAALLKSILDLDSLSAVRDRAKEAADRLTPLLHDAEAERAKLPANPAADVANASTRFREAFSKSELLAKAGRTVAEANGFIAEARRSSGQCREAEARLREKCDDDLVDRFSELVALDERLNRQSDTLRVAMTGYEEKAEALAEKLKDADEEGVGVAATSSALAALDGLTDRLSEWQKDQTALDTERSSIDQARVAAALEAKAESELARARENACLKEEQAEADADEAWEQVERGRTSLRDARGRSTAVADAEIRLAALQDKVEKLGDVLTEARKKVKAVQEAADTAQDGLAAAQRANAAAHASAASAPGDPCPVCARTLPESFSPHEIPSLAGAEQAVADAKAALTEVEKAVRAADRSKSRADGELGIETEKTEALVRQRDIALQELRDQLGDVDLGASDDVVLLALETTAAELTEAASIAKAEAEQARRAHDKLIHRIESSKEEFERREKATSTQADTLAARRQDIETTFRELPPAFHRGAELSVAAIRDAIERATARRLELNDLEEQRKSLLADAAPLRTELNALQVRHRDEVERPWNVLVQQVHVLAERTSVVITLVKQGEIPARPQKLALADDVNWASDIASAARSAVKACADQADALDRQIITAEKDVAAAYSEVAVADGEALTALIRENDVALELAARDRRTAELALPRCQELDERLAAARPVVNALRELAAQLSDGKFVNNVVRRRQRRVLLVANTIFGRMTDDQFGFADDFRIIDTSTAQARDVKTLSGGETFLASLALALALVEITSRGAGRVEALFLDEGFGTLDTNALAWALDELHRNAGNGRLVAVISHMRDVAVNFENILVVEKSSRTSSARWLSAEERNDLMADELLAGLRS